MSINPVENPTHSSEWNRLWQVVRETPDDFASWEQLVQVTEATEGGITKSSSSETITQLENVYDSFLAKFPLFFGYWKRYADFELAVHGDEGAEKIFERGVVAVHNSIDLWNQYIDFKMSHSASNEEIESLLERGASCVGLDFLARPFWDKYIAFAETRLADPKRVLSLLDRIVIIPMKEHDHYLEKWRSLRSEMKPTDALNPAILDQFYKEIREEKGDLQDDELNAALKEKLEAQTLTVHKLAQEGKDKRLAYEEGIKRSYFHVKPLERPQLQNWSKYLDFEESVGNLERVRALYERCLVPCAQYEEFWLRYGQWLTKSNLLTEAGDAYERAAYTFLSRDRPSVKIALALVQEEKGNIEEARNIYTIILESMPTHIETIVNLLHFERRQDPSKFKNEIDRILESAQLSDLAKVYLTVQLARFLKKNKQSDEARSLYSRSSLSGSNIFLQSKYFWANYIDFELSFDDDASKERILEVFENAFKNLPVESRKSINTRYRGFILEHDDSIHRLNRASLSVSTDFLDNDVPAVNPLKREAPEDIGYSTFAKQPRFDPPQPQQAYAGFAGYQGGANYYNQQSQTAYQPQQAYAEYARYQGGPDYYNQQNQAAQQPQHPW